MGHGSGGRYFGRSYIRESDCRAVSVLMGCSSVRIIDEGPGFDGRSSVYEYLIARAVSLSKKLRLAICKEQISNSGGHRSNNALNVS